MSLSKQKTIKMNAVEQADAAQKMYDQGYDQKHIAKKLGVSIPQISNLRMISSLPLIIKKRIANNQVATTLLLEIIRDNSDLSQDDAVFQVEEVIKNSPENYKVTRKDLIKKYNASIQFL